MPISSFDEFIQRVATHRNTREVLGAVIGIALAWIVGKGIAGGQYGFAIIVGGLIVFLVAYFNRHAIVVLFPLVIAVPNIGLDIPGPWAVTVQDGFVMLTFSGYLTRRIIQRQFIVPRDDAIVRPLLLFLGVAILCVGKVIAVSPDNLVFNVKELMRLAMLVLFYVVMIDVLDSKQQLFRLVRWLLAWSVWMMVVSVYIYLTLSPFWYFILTMQPAYIFMRTKILRLVSIAGSTSYTGIYYASILALATHFAPLFANRARRLWGSLLVAGIICCLVFTFNRGTWVGILLGVAALLLKKQIDRRRAQLAAVLLAGILVLTTTSLFGDIDVEQHAVDFVHYSRSSAQSRIVRWVSAVNVILEHPLLGVGYNNYAFVYGRYSITEGITTMYGSPHNMFVDVITGTGLIGFVIFMTLISRLWRQLAANMAANLPRDLHLLSRGLFLAFVFFLGTCLFDSFLFKPHHSSYLIVAVWAMGTAIHRMRTGVIAEPSLLPPDATGDVAPEERR